jgi:hypothetical protein
MTTLNKIKEDFEHELLNAKSDMESNMIRAEYNFRIKKLETEGPEAYELAYIIPNQEKDEDCGCGKD